jgi:hypothetical protein
MKHETLKPNGISHTVYPDQPAEDFNEWTANFTRQEVARDADEFKRKFDALVRKHHNPPSDCRPWQHAPRLTHPRATA